MMEKTHIIKYIQYSTSIHYSYSQHQIPGYQVTSFAAAAEPLYDVMSMIVCVYVNEYSIILCMPPI